MTARFVLNRLHGGYHRVMRGNCMRHIRRSAFKG